MNILIILGIVGNLILTVYLYKRRPQTLERRVLDLEGIVNRQISELLELSRKIALLERCNGRLIQEGLKLEAQVIGLGHEPEFRFSDLEGAREK